MGQSDELLVEREGHVLRCSINREDRLNSLSVSVAAGLIAAFEDADSDPDVRAILVTAKGERMFCAGGDLAADFSGEGMEKVAQGFADLIAAMDGLGTPLIARVNGHCLGGGMGLMLSCDLAVACDDVEFATPEAKIGLFPMMIAPLIVRHAGPKRAMDMFFSGRRVSAREAEALGLINRAVPRNRLDETVDELIAAVLAGAPRAISLGRRALAETRHLPPREATPELGRRLLEVLKTEDATEGISAFLQKRKPEWKGR